MFPNMGFWDRLFPTSAPLETQIAEIVADRLDQIDPGSLPTVVAGRMLIADTAATMPLVAHDGRTRITPTPALLRRPDPAEPYRTTIEKICNSLTAAGMAWMRVYRTSRDTGYPLAVRVVNPKRVAWELSSTGDEITRIWVDGIDTPLADMRWIAFRSDLGPIGRSPLQDIRAVVESLAAVYRFGANYYSWDAAVPPYVINHPTRLTRDKARELSDEWVAARAARRPAVLSGGIGLETFSPQSAADALMLQAVDSLDAAIARALLIPPSLLNVVSQSSLTYATTIDEFRRWLQLGLFPGYLSRIEAAFSDMLPRGTDAVFDTSSLVRMDFAARVDAYAASLAAGIHTVGEVRALEGLPQTPAGDPDPVAPNVEGL
jgi:HK97 family phage portal protein